MAFSPEDTITISNPPSVRVSSTMLWMKGSSSTTKIIGILSTAQPPCPNLDSAPVRVSFPVKCAKVNMVEPTSGRAAVLNRFDPGAS
jgi:hypothetical protein